MTHNNDDKTEQNNEQNDKIHNYTGQPLYDGLRDWAEGDLDHNQQRDMERYPYPVVFDIETTADVGQRPIFLYAIDDMANTARIAYDPDYLSDEFDGMAVNEVNEYMKKQTDYKTKVYNRIGKQVMDDILNDISNFNDNHDSTKTLVGHNVFFDLGIMGEPNPEIFDLNQYDSDEWDGCISYNDNAVLHKRAGVDGRLYQFIDGNDRKYIPVTDTLVNGKSMRLSGSLKNLCEELGVKYYEDEDGQEHGEINKDYIKYALNDVVATLSVFKRLRQRMTNMFNTQMNLSKVYSTASIGKQMMREQGYNRVDYDPQTAGICAGAFIGGQTEAHKPGVLCENKTYMDFLSQYPTGSMLTDVWRFNYAEKVRAKEIDPDDLPTPNLDDFRKQDAWSECADYYVRIKCDNAMLPVRVESDVDNSTKVLKGRVTTNVSTDKTDEITLNNDGEVIDKVTVEDEPNGVLYHYLDVIGAMLYGDCDIEIKEAYEMLPIGRQELESTKIGGKVIEPYKNLMGKTIEIRKEIQYNENDGEKDQRTLANKITANSLFGVSAERILMKHQIETDDGTEIVRYDQAGTFYNPHVGSTITASGRLMLTIGEIIANNNGGEVVYNDTDSLIADSHVADDVMEWFNQYLNPYDGVAGEQDFLEIEEYEGEKLDNIKIYTVGVKKYVILDDKNKILMNKEHGLGHFAQLRNTEQNPNRTKKFWGTLLSKLGVLDGRVPRFTKAQMDEMVTWQTAATTETMRQQMDKLTDKTVRYGDFIKRSINPKQTGEIVQYIGLDLQDKAYKIVKGADGEYKSMELVENMEREHLKTIEDVLTDWMVRVNQAQTGRQSYTIVGLRAVTKESSNLQIAYDEENTEYFSIYSNNGENEGNDKE